MFAELGQPVEREKKLKLLLTERDRARTELQPTSGEKTSIESAIHRMSKVARAVTRAIYHTSGEKSHKFKASQSRIGEDAEFGLSPRIQSIEPQWEEESYNREFPGTAQIVRIKVHQNVRGETIAQRTSALRKNDERNERKESLNVAGWYEFVCGSDVDICIKDKKGRIVNLFQEKDAKNDFDLYRRILDKIGAQSPYIQDDGYIHIVAEETTGANELNTGIGGGVTRQHTILLRPIHYDDLAYIMFGRSHALARTAAERMDKLVAKYPTQEQRDIYLCGYSDNPDKMKQAYLQWKLSNGGIRLDSAFFLDPQYGNVVSIDGHSPESKDFEGLVESVRRVLRGDPEHLPYLLEVIMEHVYSLLKKDRMAIPQSGNDVDKEKARHFAGTRNVSAFGPDNPFSHPWVDYTEYVSIQRSAMALVYNARHFLLAQPKQKNNHDIIRHL